VGQGIRSAFYHAGLTSKQRIKVGRRGGRREEGGGAVGVMQAGACAKLKRDLWLTFPSSQIPSRAALGLGGSR